MYLSERTVYAPIDWYLAAKRLLDVTLCLMAMPVLLVVLAIVACAVKLDSPGPVMFVQTRVGLAGRPFRMFKFRTLKHNFDDEQARAFMVAFVRGGDSVAAPENGGTRRVYKPMTAKDVTRVGRLLRRTSLDELPQILNVLRGEMSVVGPRPNVPWEVDAYRSWHLERLTVLPGITGMAQVHGRSGISFDEIANYDIEYVRHRSVKLDLLVLGRTVTSVLSAKGAG